VLSEKPPGSQQSSLLWLPDSRYKYPLRCLALLQPYSSSPSARASSQPPPIFSHTVPCAATHTPTRHPGCDHTKSPTVHPAAGSGDLQGPPVHPSTCTSSSPAPRSPCLAEGAHFYSQDTAVAHSHTGTGTSLVALTISFLI